jgi:hypothetical protein
MLITGVNYKLRYWVQKKVNSINVVRFQFEASLDGEIMTAVEIQWTTLASSLKPFGNVILCFWKFPGIKVDHMEIMLLIISKVSI